jgi:hypothetical protein
MTYRAYYYISDPTNSLKWTNAFADGDEMSANHGHHVWSTKNSIRN